eukprot:6154794-Prymnesium_polylepis.1
MAQPRLRTRANALRRARSRETAVASTSGRAWSDTTQTDRQRDPRIGSRTAGFVASTTWLLVSH